jgi:hypothetical protein
MEPKELEELHPGDMIYWRDPVEDEYPKDACSKFIVIQTIEIIGDIICVSWKDGGYLECYAHELS